MRKIVGWMLLVGVVLLLNLSPVSAYEDTPFYFGVGYASLEADIDSISNLTGTASLDDEDEGFKVFAGFKFCSWFALEAGLVDIGEYSLSANSGDTVTIDGVTLPIPADGTEVEQDGTAITLAGIFLLPLDRATGNVDFKWVTPFAKLGVYYWDVDGIISTGGSTIVTASDDGFGVLFGAGLQVDFHENIGIRAEYERYDGDDELDSLSASIVIKF